MGDGQGDTEKTYAGEVHVGRSQIGQTQIGHAHVWPVPRPLAAAAQAIDLWLPTDAARLTGLARALRRERARAGVRGSGYDPGRHLALLRAWRDARRGPV